MNPEIIRERIELIAESVKLLYKVLDDTPDDEIPSPLVFLAASNIERLLELENEFHDTHRLEIVARDNWYEKLIGGKIPITDSKLPFMTLYQTAQEKESEAYAIVIE